ncbi:MAG: hypothetical protein LBT53_05890 [Puniceicoccales bacterium]|nr:hypothetical protein [Puniceicoccales bacterium]
MPNGVSDGSHRHSGRGTGGHSARRGNGGVCDCCGIGGVFLRLRLMAQRTFFDNFLEKLPVAHSTFFGNFLTSPAVAHTAFLDSI